MKSHLTLITTTRCNFRCRHCLREHPDAAADLPLGPLSPALAEAKAMGVRQIALTGGEAGLHPRFDDLLDLVCGQHGLDWSLVTNGAQPALYARALQRYGNRCKFIAVSLDGGTAATHDWVRQPGSFRLALAALDQFKAQGIYTKIAFTVNTRNFDEKRQVLKLALKHRVDEIRFAGHIPTEGTWYLALSGKQKEAIKALIQQLIETRFPARVTHTTSLYAPRDKAVFCSNLTDPEPTISPRGEYLFCCDTPGRGAVIGDLDTMSFGEAYVKQIKTGVGVRNAREARLKAGAHDLDWNTCTLCESLLHEGALESTAASFLPTT